MINVKAFFKKLLRLILSAVWGKVEGKSKNKTWTLAHDRLQTNKPDPFDKNLLNYFHFKRL